MSKHRLFGDLAHRYDLHTPASHYQHDHQFVIDLAKPYGPGVRLLDVGCGTGAFVAKARAVGIDAYGIDSSPEMIEHCRAALGKGVAEVRRMEELDFEGVYDVVCALSWTLHYAEGTEAVKDVIRRMKRALRGNGTMVLQLAHAPNATGELFVDREPGPTGEPDDIVFMYRFVRSNDKNASLTAQYTYICWSERELLYEDHVLMTADAQAIAEIARGEGFLAVNLLESWRSDSFDKALSPLLVAKT